MNTWIEHVKNYQLKHNLNYRDALKEAKQTYKGGYAKSNYKISTIFLQPKKNIILCVCVMTLFTIIISHLLLVGVYINVRFQRLFFF